LHGQDMQHAQRFRKSGLIVRRCYTKITQLIRGTAAYRQVSNEFSPAAIVGSV
jgi:hypothetical protein